MDESLTGPKTSSKLGSKIQTSTKIIFNALGQKKEVQQYRLTTGWLQKIHVRNQVKYEAAVHPCSRKANSMLCCINRCTVRELGKMVVPLFFILLWRYVLSCPQFCHPRTRGVTGRQARGGSVTWLRACMGKG